MGGKTNQLPTSVTFHDWVSEVCVGSCLAKVCRPSSALFPCQNPYRCSRVEIRARATFYSSVSCESGAQRTSSISPFTRSQTLGVPGNSPRNHSRLSSVTRWSCSDGPIYRDFLNWGALLYPQDLSTLMVGAVYGSTAKPFPRLLASSGGCGTADGRFAHRHTRGF